MDTVKNAVANAVALAVTNAAAGGLLVSWPVEVQRLGNLELLITVRPVEGQPRRTFLVKISEPV